MEVEMMICKLASGITHSYGIPERGLIFLTAFKRCSRTPGSHCKVHVNLEELQFQFLHMPVRMEFRRAPCSAHLQTGDPRLPVDVSGSAVSQLHGRPHIEDGLVGSAGSWHARLKSIWQGVHSILAFNQKLKQTTSLRVSSGGLSNTVQALG
jgi:hypothetical protein